MGVGQHSLGLPGGGVSLPTQDAPSAWELGVWGLRLDCAVEKVLRERTIQ